MNKNKRQWLSFILVLSILLSIVIIVFMLGLFIKSNLLDTRNKISISELGNLFLTVLKIGVAIITSPTESSWICKMRFTMEKFNFWCLIVTKREHKFQQIMPVRPINKLLHSFSPLINIYIPLYKLLSSYTLYLTN